MRLNVPNPWVTREVCFNSVTEFFNLNSIQINFSEDFNTHEKENGEQSENLSTQTERFIRVKKNLFANQVTNLKKIEHESDENYFVQDEICERNEAEIDDSKSSTNDNDDLQENIVCSPELTQYIDNDKEDFRGKKSELNSNEAKIKNYSSNLTLFELISQKRTKVLCEDDKDTDNENNFSISPCSNVSKSTYMMDIEEKSSIGGLFLRNPRGFLLNFKN